MAVYDVQWQEEINGESPQDAATQAVTMFQQRTGKVLVRVRTRHDGKTGPWEPVEVGIAAGG